MNITRTNAAVKFELALREVKGFSDLVRWILMCERTWDALNGVPGFTFYEFLEKVVANAVSCGHEIDLSLAATCCTPNACATPTVQPPVPTVIVAPPAPPAPPVSLPPPTGTVSCPLEPPEGYL